LVIDIVVYNGLDEMDALGPLEVFRSAGQAGVDLTTRLVTRTEQSQITGAFGLCFSPDTIYQPGQADVVLVPGGGWAARAQAGAFAEVQRGDWLPHLAEAANTAAIVAGVCTGTMLLAHAGVVGSRRAVTHHTARQDLAALGATVVEDRVVDDGNLITSGGVTSGIDLALWLLEREFGRELADSMSARMEYSRTRPSQ
jgi:transcriptional regulator GlxA family with amidase domain